MHKVSTIVLLSVGIVLLANGAYANYGHGGHSSSHYKHDGHGYKFGYDITDPYGAKNSRHEVGDGYGNKHGSYSLYDKDGRKRVVEYVADKKGFRAKIHSNEPGLKSHYAAHAHYDVDHQGYHGGHHGGYKHDDHGYGHHNEGHHGKHY